MGRTSCSADHQVSENGFKCPESALPKADGFGLSDPHPKYADPSDCAKFYICLNGVTQREHAVLRFSQKCSRVQRLLCFPGGRRRQGQTSTETIATTIVVLM